MTLADLGRHSLITYPRGHAAGFRERIDAKLRAAGITPRVVQEATQVHTMCGLVASGAGCALVPECARIFALPGVNWKRLTHNDLFVETAIAWRADNKDATLKALVTVARSAIHSPTTPKRRTPSSTATDAEH